MNVFSFKYRNIILGIAASAVAHYAILTPHTVFLNKYRYIMARYQLGKEVPLGPIMQQRIQEVMEDLKLHDDVKNLIKPFSVFGFDLFHAGTLNTKYGAILGIPVNFTNTAEQLRENLQIKEEQVDWTRQDANTFLSASMLSENAQKFAIAHEILQILAEEPYYNSIELMLIVAVLWTLYNAIIYRFNLRERNVILCRSLYSSFTLFGAIFWFGIKDYQSYRFDRKTDEVLCNLGTEYIKGGQEFYEKMLIRNRAIRSLLGDEGKKLYTAYGNKQNFLRQKHVPISHKKDFYDSRLQNLN
ncbi:transmembrane protein 177 [Linepithema humile]|uniref:transmembrane protein 177 n=1 Tax=Linepithema humile TaxID=83485 RepID=UPI0006236765|nr:PREDICTED: transmembrane protein 177 [Linepithema humile]